MRRGAWISCLSYYDNHECCTAYLEFDSFGNLVRIFSQHIGGRCFASFLQHRLKKMPRAERSTNYTSAGTRPADARGRSLAGMDGIAARYSTAISLTLAPTTSDIRKARRTAIRAKVVNACNECKTSRFTSFTSYLHMILSHVLQTRTI
jgi:hypothetical protein